MLLSGCPFTVPRLVHRGSLCTSILLFTLQHKVQDAHTIRKPVSSCIPFNDMAKELSLQYFSALEPVPEACGIQAGM